VSGGLYPLASPKKVETMIPLCLECKKECKQYFTKELTLFECYDFEEK